MKWPIVGNFHWFPKTPQTAPPPPHTNTTLLTHFYWKLLLAVPHCLLIARHMCNPPADRCTPAWSGGIKPNRVQSLNDQQILVYHQHKRTLCFNFTLTMHAVDFKNRYRNSLEICETLARLRVGVWGCHSKDHATVREKTSQSSTLSGIQFHLFHSAPPFFSSVSHN